MTALVTSANANVALGAVGAVIAVGLFVWFETPFQVALASFIDRWHRDGELLDDVEAGYVPPPAYDMFDELEMSRPEDIEDCGRCEGLGDIITVEGGLPGYRRCPWCAGRGVRGAA